MKGISTSSIYFKLCRVLVLIVTSFDLLSNSVSLAQIFMKKVVQNLKKIFLNYLPTILTKIVAAMIHQPRNFEKTRQILFKNDLNVFSKFSVYSSIKSLSAVDRFSNAEMPYSPIYISPLLFIYLYITHLENLKKLIISLEIPHLQII